jgi:pimeloyl-ACP methyl ester carboxylesterase
MSISGIQGGPMPLAHAATESPRSAQAGGPAEGLRRIQGQQPDTHGIFKSLGFNYTSWGTNHSLGSLTTTALKVLTLSMPARALGEVIQGGHDSGSRYWAGAMVKGLANITGGIAGIAGGAVSMAEAVVSNLAGATLRLIGAGALGLVGLGAKAVGLVSKTANDDGNHILGKAKALATGISFLNKGEQRPLDVAGATTVLPHALMARIGATTRAHELRLPQGYTRATLDDIPKSVLSRENGGVGEFGKLRFENGMLSGDKWSALKVNVFKGPGDQIFLSFVGTEPGRLATFKSDASQAMGIEDSAFQDADRLVAGFKQAYPDGNLQLIGHSLGGALATFAGIRHNVPVTGFNSAGLHINLRNALGADAIDRAGAKLRHFNTGGDLLSQVAEGRRFGLDASSQVGQRFSIPGSAGHKMEQLLDDLRAAAQLPDYGKSWLAIAKERPDNVFQAGDFGLENLSPLERDGLQAFNAATEKEVHARTQYSDLSPSANAVPIVRQTPE